jgi:hypothetical protein
MTDRVSEFGTSVAQALEEGDITHKTAGDLLREAREAHGLHIEMVAAALKVPPQKLLALEADDIASLPDPGAPSSNAFPPGQACAGASRVVTVGGDAPVRVQSMTNTDTVDAIGTAIQVKELAIAGSEMVRITVNTPEAAAQVPYIREQLDRMGIDVPLIGDFHYNGHRLLTDYPACAEALSKYRINPGNVGKGDKKDRQFGQMIEAAMKWDKPVRIGVNWGSLDQELLASLMDENASAPCRGTPSR